MQMMSFLPLNNSFGFKMIVISEKEWGVKYKLHKWVKRYQQIYSNCSQQYWNHPSVCVHTVFTHMQELTLTQVLLNQSTNSEI